MKHINFPTLQVNISVKALLLANFLICCKDINIVYRTEIKDMAQLGGSFRHAVKSGARLSFIAG